MRERGTEAGVVSTSLSDPLPPTLYSLPSESLSSSSFFFFFFLLSRSRSFSLSRAPVVIYSGDYSTIESTR